MNEILLERVRQLPVLHRVRALQAMNHRRKDLLDAAAVALYVSGVHNALHRAGNMMVDIGKRFPPVFTHVGHVQESQPGDLVVLSSGSLETHLGVVVDERDVFSFHDYQANQPFTIEPLEHLQRRYHGRRVDYYRRNGYTTPSPSA